MIAKQKTLNHIPFEEWLKERDNMVDLANENCFSNDIILDERETKCEKILAKMREELLTEDTTINTGSYEEKSPKIANSNLFDCLKTMPKPSMAYFYLCSCSPEWIVKKLLYYDFVYLNEAEGVFKVSKDPNFNESGFIAVNVLRAFWSDSSTFDNHLTNLIMLDKEALAKQEHRAIF